MNDAAKRDKLEASYQAYENQRAQDKYDGKVEQSFPLKEFRKCADYLAGVLQNAAFDAEDIGDLVRVALSRHEKATEAGERSEAR